MDANRSCRCLHPAAAQARPRAGRYLIQAGLTWRFPLHGRRRPTHIFIALECVALAAAAVVAVLSEPGRELGHRPVRRPAGLLDRQRPLRGHDVGREDLRQLPVAGARDGLPGRCARVPDRRRHDRRRLAAVARLARPALLNNLVAYAWFPLIGGIVFTEVSQRANLARARRLLLPADLRRLRARAGDELPDHRGSTSGTRRAPAIRELVRKLVVPVLSSEVFAALLAVGVTLPLHPRRPRVDRARSASSCSRSSGCSASCCSPSSARRSWRSAGTS